MQLEFDADRMAAETFRLEDKAGSYEVKVKAVKSASSPILLPVTPVVAAADVTSPRHEHDIAMEDLREGTRAKEGKDEVRVGMKHNLVMGKEQQLNVLRSEVYFGEVVLQGKNAGVGSEMMSLTASLSSSADGKGPTAVHNMDLKDMFILETAAHATSSRLSTPESGDGKDCGIREGGVEKVGSCDSDLQQELNIERSEGGRGGDMTSPRGGRESPSSITVPSSPNGTPTGPRKRQKLDLSAKGVEVVESRDYDGVMTGQGREGAVKRRVTHGPGHDQVKKIKIEECDRVREAGKARGEGNKGAGSRGKRSTKCSRLNAVLSDSGEEAVNDYEEAQSNFMKGGDLSDKDEEWTHADG